MKIKVYQCVTDEYIDMEVLAIYRYNGKSDPIYFIKGKSYYCVGYEENMARLVDETGEDYLYSLKNFELVEDYGK